MNGIPAATVSLTNVSGMATAAYTTTSLEGGTDYVTASFLGSTQFTSSSSGPLRHDVGPASTSTGVTTAYNPINAGQPVYFGATVTDTSPNSSAVPTGSVAFYLNGSTTPFDTEPLGYQGAGSAYATYTFTKTGTYTITAKYLGDSDFTVSTGRLSPDLQINPGPAATLTLTAPPTATAGQPFQATVSETDAYGNPVTDPATVTFTSTDARAVLPAPVSLTNGTATVTVTDDTAGSQTLTASASGHDSGDGGHHGLLGPAGRAQRLGQQRGAHARHRGEQHDGDGLVHPGEHGRGCGQCRQGDGGQTRHGRRGQPARPRQHRCRPVPALQPDLHRRAAGGHDPDPQRHLHRHAQGRLHRLRLQRRQESDRALKPDLIERFMMRGRPSPQGEGRLPTRPSTTHL